MDLRNQLPYLGKKQKNGTLSIGNIQINRPDYKAFIDGIKYKSEAECVSILLGIKDINSVFVQLFQKINKYCNIEANKVVEEAFNELPPAVFYKNSVIQKIGVEQWKKKFQDLENSEDPKIRELWALLNILIKLRKDISLGASNCDLKALPFGSKADKEYDQNLFKYFKGLFCERYGIYSRNHFLKWAKNDGDYDLPKELKSYIQSDETDFKTDKPQKKDIVPQKNSDQDKEKRDFDAALRKFQFEYVNNNEVKITVEKNKHRTKSAGDLGFDLTKGRQAWDVLIEVLEQPPHKYSCGQSKTKKEKTEYQRRYGLLREISKKLVMNFFNKAPLELNLPDAYKLFENVKGESGVFKFIFKVKDRSTLSSCTSKSEFLFQFNKAYKAARKYPYNRNKQQLVIDLVGDAKNKGYITEVEEEFYFRKAEESIKRIKKIDKNNLEEGRKPQPEIHPNDSDIDYSANIDNYSDENL